MKKNAKTGRRILIAAGIVLAVNLYALLASGVWNHARTWRIEHACPMLCTQAEQVQRDRAPGLKEAAESITKSARPSVDEREQYRQRTLYRARNLIGWT